MIHFRDSDREKERLATEPLTEAEEVEVIDYLNSMVSKEADENTERERLLQRFVYNYENMKKNVE